MYTNPDNGAKAKEHLAAIFEHSTTVSVGVDAKRYRADYYEDVDVLDKLESDGYLERTNDKYFVRLPSLKIISYLPKVKNLFESFNVILEILQEAYRHDPGESVALTEICETSGLAQADVIDAMSYMKQGPILSGYTTDLTTANATVFPAERILRYRTFDDVVDEIGRIAGRDLIQLQPFGQGYIGLPFPRGDEYVSAERLEELRNATFSAFDLRKLIRLCEELNSNSLASNYYATAALVRMIIDYVPPLFGFTAFREVSNNYGGKSLRQSFNRLESSSRKIADGLLHQPAQKTEVLPNRVTVNFSNDLDLLLGEIVRISKQAS